MIPADQDHKLGIEVSDGSPRPRQTFPESATLHALGIPVHPRAVTGAHNEDVVGASLFHRLDHACPFRRARARHHGIDIEYITALFWTHLPLRLGERGAGT